VEWKLDMGTHVGGKGNITDYIPHIGPVCSFGHQLDNVIGACLKVEVFFSR
jgi:hypothetical protein